MSKDVFERLTENVIRALEEGQANGKLEMPWRQVRETPYNPATGASYRGTNSFGLMIDQHVRKMPGPPAWATFKQWQDLGAIVRAGEKAAGTVVVWREVKQKEERPDPGTGEVPKKVMPISAPVFHASQVDGWTAPELDRKSEVVRNEAIEATVRNMDIEVEHGGDRAVYYRTHDFSREGIRMPPREAFVASSDGKRSATEGYYATLLHEVGHATMHPDRCGRDASHNGDMSHPGYAREELVAEMSSSFLCAEFGIRQADAISPDHVRYIGSWLKALKDDRNLLRDAAKDATHAAEYVIEKVPERYRAELGLVTKADQVRIREEHAARVSERREARAAQQAEQRDAGVASLSSNSIALLRAAEAAGRETHVTGKGKTLICVVVRDPSFGPDQAKLVDPYAFRAHGGQFMREKDVFKTLETIDRASPSTPEKESVAPAQQQAIGQRDDLRGWVRSGMDRLERSGVLGQGAPGLDRAEKSAPQEHAPRPLERETEKQR